MQQVSIVAPYIEEHKHEQHIQNRGRTEAWIVDRESFGSWLRLKLTGVETGHRELDLLAMGPSSNVLIFQGYDINAYTFYTKKQDDKSANQNSGVRIDALGSNNQTESCYVRIEEIES